MNASFEISSRPTVQTLSKHDLENKLKQLYTKYGQDAENFEIAQTLFDIGTIESNPDTAIEYFSNALFMYRTVFSEEGIEIHSNIAQTLYRLGEVQLIKRDYVNARNSCEQAWEMYKSLDEAVHLETMSRVLDMLKEICMAQGDINYALYYSSEATDALRTYITQAPTPTQAHATGTPDDNAPSAQVAYPTEGQSSSSNLPTRSDRTTPPKSSSCLDALYDCFGLFRTPTDGPATIQTDVIASPVHNSVVR